MKIDRSFWYTNHVQWHTNHFKEKAKSTLNLTFTFLLMMLISFVLHTTWHINLLQQNMNTELNNVSMWLRSNKLSLNIQKSSFVSFHPPQKKDFLWFPLILENKCLNQEKCIKYLSVFIDTSLSWKFQIQYISTKRKRGVRILSKIRYYVDINVLSNPYYALIYPFSISSLSETDRMVQLMA